MLADSCFLHFVLRAFWVGEFVHQYRDWLDHPYLEVGMMYGEDGDHEAPRDLYSRRRV